MRRKIKVLITDDSLLFREFLKEGLSKDENIEVVGTAGDVYETRDKIIQFNPDVLTLDLELPKMDGIRFLQKLMPQYPIPTVIVSAVSCKVFEALNAGAVDFVTKPQARIREGMDTFINELIVKIKIASTAKVSHWKKSSREDPMQRINASLRTKGHNVIAIGASTGGTEATYGILKNLPKDTPGILVTQHMPENFTRMYAERLNDSCFMEVKEAETGDEVLRGRVLIAPGNKHMKVKKRGGILVVDCFYDEKVNGHRPSVDVLFNSVAQEIGKNAIGVILTGMGYDGAKGLLNMREKGAVTIGQNEKSSVVYGMPKVAYEIGAVQTQVSLEEIPKLIYSFI